MATPLPALPPVEPFDAFDLSPADQATFYDWITAKYNVEGTTGQPVNTIGLSYPPSCLSPDDPGYSPTYAEFIAETYFSYIYGTVGY